MTATRSFTIRQTTPKDWQAVKNLRLQALADAPYAFAETLAEAEDTPDAVWQERIRQNSEGEKSICALAIAGDQPVGMAVGLRNPEGNNNAHLVAMWVAPEQRGSGVAEALIEFIVDWAQKLGAAALVAGVTENNPRAQAFYRRVGFEIVPNPRPLRSDPSVNEIQIQMTLKE